MRNILLTAFSILVLVTFCSAQDAQSRWKRFVARLFRSSKTEKLPFCRAHTSSCIAP